MTHPKTVGIGTVVVCVVIAFLAAPVTGIVRFTSFSASGFTQLLAPLFLAALFIERVLEVFLSGWRGPACFKAPSDGTRTNIG